jgi:hypothetical protein
VYDWLLFFHVLSAFLLAGALAFFWALLLVTRPGRAFFVASASLALARPATVAVSIGTLGTLILGLWLAIYLDAYHPWDGWILGSLVLWLIGSGAGARSGRVLAPVGERYPSSEARRQGIVLHSIASLATLGVLVLMIWKPGA